MPLPYSEEHQGTCLKSLGELTQAIEAMSFRDFLRWNIEVSKAHSLGISTVGVMLLYLEGADAPQHAPHSNDFLRILP